MKKYRNILFGVVLLISFLFINVNVEAKSCKIGNKTKNYSDNKTVGSKKYNKDVKDYCKEEEYDIYSYYNVNISKKKSGVFTVKVACKADGCKGDELKISSINGKTSGKYIGDIIKNGHSKDLNIKANSNGNVRIGLRVVKTSGKYRVCIGKNNKATDKILSCDKYYDAKGTLEIIEEITSQGDAFKGMPKDKTNDMYEYADKKANNYNYTYYAEWEELGKHNPDKVDVKKVKNVDELKCDANSKLKTTRDSNNNYIYANKKYFETSETQPIDGATITYTHDYGANKKYTSKSTEKNLNVCEQECIERVKVEYGAPVASKAGLCFEYQVKVTSYVKCNVKPNKNSIPRRENYAYCVPSPVCNGTTKYRHQAGPNVAFDNCVEKCDGGKYSKKCSNKCYEEVYGESSNESLSMRDTSAEVTKVKNTKKNSKKKNNKTKKVNKNKELCGNSAGCYYLGGDSKVRWNVSTTQGRWYTLANYKPKWTSKTVNHYVKEGFVRAQYRGGSSCPEPCKWTQCDGKSEYLNDTHAERDYKKAVAAWKKKVDLCTAKANCTTSTSTYTIGTYYSIKGEMKKKDFPMTTKKEDHLCSKNPEESSSSTCTATNTGKDTTLLLPKQGDRSCYTSNPDDVWYQAEWSFPGTWINNKTGDISYTSKTDDGWKEETNKFCLPLNAQTTNDKWWQWNQLGNTCYGNSSQYTGGDINYNIYAKTIDFGHFKWNFDISCFYAIRNEECVPNSTGCCKTTTVDKCDKTTSKCTSTCIGDCNKTTTTDGANDFEFRIVDTANLFPNENNSGTNVGFNWTEAANTADINIKSVIQSIQSKKVIYDKSNLDYEFTLSKANLMSIRNFSTAASGKNGNYATFMGKVETTADKYGIYRYRSGLLRDIGKYVDKYYINSSTKDSISRYAK